MKKKLELDLEKLSAFMEKLPKIVDTAVYGGVAYAGYEIFQDWKGALFAVVSLKLAQSPGGTPPVAQIAGVAGLSMLGLAAVTDTTKDPSKRLDDALQRAGATEEQRKEFMEKNKNYLKYIDMLNKVQQVLPGGGVWNMMWKWFEEVT